MRLLSLTIAATLIFAGFNHGAESISDTDENTKASIEIKKSPGDPNNYRYLKLDNDLTAILISRSGPGKAGAALAVARGSNHDLPNIPGIAHYLEHMLFLGTEKYPDPDGYSDYISKHGGTMNAFTANELTNYFFDIDEEYFPEALDRFAQFFTAPLLDETYVEREKNAVHSEYQMQMRSDNWRGFSVLKTVMNQDHPMSRFSIGSAETLKDADRETVLKYYQDNYSSDQMTLTVLSGQPLDKIETLVLDLFSDVPNRELGDAPLPPSLYDPEALPLAYGYQTVMSNRSLSLEWPVPDIKPHYRSKPLSYVANLVGHEGEGSLHALLMERGLINSLGASPNRDDRANSSFNVAIQLTEKGWEQIDEVRALTFEYIDMLREEPIEEWRYQEQATMRDLDFRFVNQQSTTATVNRLTQASFEYEPEDLIQGAYLMENFDADLIRNYLNYLTRENSITVISAPDLETEETEPWFEVPYTQKPTIDLDLKVEHEFTLPAKNPYIPTNTDLQKDVNVGIPVLMLDGDGLEVWHTADPKFEVPRAVLSLRLRYKTVADSASDAVHGALLSQLLNIEFNTESYPALLAGLQGSFQHSPDGLTLTVSGYNDKLGLLLNQMLDLVKSYKVDTKQLETQKIEQSKFYRNFKDTRPFQQAYSTLGHVLVSTSWPPAILDELVAGVTTESLEKWAEEALAEVAARMLVVGNMTNKQAKEIGKEVEANLNLVPVKDRLPDVQALEDIYTLNLNIEHDDAVYLATYQAEASSFKDRATVRMIDQIINQAFFNDLRTEQQLGYVTIARNAELVKHPHLVFLVQSPVADAKQLREATLTFIEKQRKILSEMEQETFDSFRNGLLTLLLDEDKNLSQRATRYSINLNELIKTFDTREQLAEEIKLLTIEDVRATYDSLLSPSGKNRLEIYSPGKSKTILEQGTALDGPGTFKVVSR